MENQKLAEELTEAIKKLVSNPNNLDNFEFYLACHFSTWIKQFASTPEGLVSEFKSFAEME